MITLYRRQFLCGAVSAALLSAVASRRGIADDLPTVYLIGDSTVNTHGKIAGTDVEIIGWGAPIAAFFDPMKAHLVNKARGGRSSRTYWDEGLWAEVEKALKPGDWVLMQFGHNDGGALNRAPYRASLKGIGDETQPLTIPDKPGPAITVHSYGWYLAQYVQQAKAKGATPIVLSPIPRNIWKDGKVGRSAGDYGGWAKAIAEREKVPFLDLNALVADHYDKFGETKVATDFFDPKDHTHTKPAGAQFNASCVVEGLRAQPDLKINSFLLNSPHPAR